MQARTHDRTDRYGEALTVARTREEQAEQRMADARRMVERRMRDREAAYRGRRQIHASETWSP
jgi:hypothetical protein